MRLTFAAFSTVMSLIAASAAGSAASLQVTPVSLDVPAPTAATTITLNNPGNIPLKAQVRVFKWLIVNGEEHLDPTADVVASPPVASLQPKTDYVVRVVRTSKAPVAAEETYRLVIDEIPDRTNQPKNTIAMAFRYSVPVFFTPNGGGNASLAWATHTVNGKTYLSATNSGSRRVRIADLKVSDDKGRSVVIAKGLAGYVLARSSMSWVAPDTVASAGTPMLVEASGDQGPINARTILNDSH